MTFWDLKNPVVLLATWFGLGLLKPAPGTWGSFGGLITVLAIYYVAGLWAIVIGFLVVTAIGFWASQEYEKLSSKKDASEIVIDEVAGMWIPLMIVPLTPLFIALAFLIFRGFDILKPWPVSWFDQKLEGPLSVMGDDIMAGLYTSLILLGLHYGGIG